VPESHESAGAAAFPPPESFYSSVFPDERVEKGARALIAHGVESIQSQRAKCHGFSRYWFPDRARRDFHSSVKSD